MYLPKEKLRQAVIESQAMGTMSPALYDAVVKLVQGIRMRWGMSEPDEILQDVCVSVLTHLQRLDPSKNLFSYLTTLVRNEVFKRLKTRSRYDHNNEKYKASLKATHPERLLR